MPLHIGDKSFTGALTQEIFAEIVSALVALPEPQVVVADNADANEENTMLCLQREGIYLNSDDPVQKINYLGTKNVNQCFLIYFYTDLDHFILHCDQTTQYNIEEVLRRFIYPSRVYVKIVGGKVNDDLSVINLTRLLTELVRIADVANIDIVITQQKIFNSNRRDKEDLYQLSFDDVVIRAALAFKHYFNKKFPLDVLANVRVSDFTTKHCNFGDDLNAILEVIFCTNKFASHRIATHAQGLFDDYVKNEDIFIRLFKGIFSIEGFDLLSSVIPREQQLSGTKFHDFAFDITTRHIVQLHAYMPTPFEAVRGVIYLNKSQGYYLFYNAHNNQFHIPTVSQMIFTTALKNAHQLCEKYPANPEQLKANILADLSMPDDNKFLSDFTKFCEYLFTGQFLVQNLTNLSAQLTFFTSRKPLAECYHADQLIMANLNNLQQLTNNQNFIARRRLNHDFIVDALLLCENDATKQSTIDVLEKSHISYKVVQFSHGTYVCVPAINTPVMISTINSELQNKLIH